MINENRFLGLYLDSVAPACGHPHGECDGRDESTAVQQWETQTFPVVSGCYAGKARETPHGETTCTENTNKMKNLHKA